MARRVAGEILAAPEMAAEIRELLAQGLSKRGIAAQLGVSEMTVYRCLRDLKRAAGERKGRREEERALPEGFARSRGAEQQGSKGAAGPQDDSDDGYPEALLRQVPRDFVAVLPREHYLALLVAAGRAGSAAAAESLRQALLLHEEPMIPPPTSIELTLSEAEELEARKRRRAGGGGAGVGRSAELVQRKLGPGRVNDPGEEDADSGGKSEVTRWQTGRKAAAGVGGTPSTT
jgi:Helix-turn-helix domain of resolvase